MSADARPGKRLPPLSSGQVSTAFARLLRKHGATPQTLRKVREITDDQKQVTVQPVRADDGRPKETLLGSDPAGIRPGLPASPNLSGKSVFVAAVDELTEPVGGSAITGESAATSAEHGRLLLPQPSASQDLLDRLKRLGQEIEELLDKLPSPPSLGIPELHMPGHAFDLKATPRDSELRLLWNKRFNAESSEVVPDPWRRSLDLLWLQPSTRFMHDRSWDALLHDYWKMSTENAFALLRQIAELPGKDVSGVVGQLSRWHFRHNVVYDPSHARPRGEELLAEAAAQYRAVLKVQARVLGTEHPDTLTTRQRLAHVLVDQGGHAEAEAEYRAILMVQTRVLGTEHPDTLTTRGNLAQVLHNQGALRD
ncbi:tetratricopeptide repeat protein [Plantactinospora endophytica]|uniref:Tetratricopeptide repeat protein n=1 Tax=Plantactinospora endophytica TaxID=673535 RepID=A0ABQ4EE95_9ACTN|nr:tetratricopeptide repeat protein [Plantactinospora endophytica]GIG93052.1 hypothetical protein Pen02_79880 [Plantactinospora endophytica]